MPQRVYFSNVGRTGAKSNFHQVCLLLPPLPYRHFGHYCRQGTTRIQEELFIMENIGGFLRFAGYAQVKA